MQVQRRARGWEAVQVVSQGEGQGTRRLARGRKVSHIYLIYLSKYFNISICKVRCFNCGNVARHLAAECPHPPLPKRCHHCKVETSWNV